MNNVVAINTKKYVEHVIKDDDENIIKIIVEEGGTIKGKDTFIVNYYNIKYGQEIRLHAEEDVILSTFELIKRAIHKLKS